MPVRAWKLRIRHIVEHIDRIQRYLAGQSYSTFLSDDKTAYAVVLCFAVIGEAARLVPVKVRAAHSNIPWSKMIRMRNVVVHEYERIDYEVVWQTSHHDLPVLKEQLLELLLKLEEPT